LIYEKVKGEVQVFLFNHSPRQKDTK